MRSLIVYKSIHHGNTEKVARRMAKVLDAELIEPQDLDIDTIKEFDLIGFGSGIYGEKHHESLLELVERFDRVSNKRAFIFSTSAIMGKAKVKKDHSHLRKRLESKGFIIVDEFACKGFNTNSFMKYLGGMNKGRPNEEDLANAEQFVKRIIQDIGPSD